MLAVEDGHEAITFLILQHGATTDAPDRSGRMPLDVATSKGYQVIEKLLGFGVPGTAIADSDRFWRSFQGHRPFRMSRRIARNSKLPPI